MSKLDINALRGGRGFGVLQKEDRKFLTPDFDVERQRGEMYVGGRATADKPGVAGDDEERG